MFVALKHTHVLMVTLFFLTYLIKTILLMTNKLDKLKTYGEKTKVPEMVISFLFLITGVWMLLLKPEINSLYYVKFAIVVGSIPLAVKGFKQYKKGLGILSFLMIVIAYGLGEMIPKMEMKRTDQGNVVMQGDALYKASNCVSCHGEDGKLGINGAADLSISKLTNEQKEEVITNGKGLMPKYKSIYTQEEIKLMVEYINEFSSNE